MLHTTQRVYEVYEEAPIVHKAEADNTPGDS